ncbi:MAG: M56 family metallopeptidase [Myxococcales bacterium]|nr:M56 family metallopeptidase [Myxococcales bacterium]
MSAGLLVFNLLLNAVGSFAVAALVCRAARRFFRDDGAAALALGSLPFVKIAWDASRGVPAGSFLYERALGAVQELGSFQLGLGVSWGVPRIQLVLGALSGGRQYAQSAPDLLSSWLAGHVHPQAPGLIGIGLLLVAVSFAARHVGASVRTAREARAIRRTRPVAELRVGARVVPVHLTDASGSPWVGGVLRPFVAFPRGVWSALSRGERDAALAHELGHVALHHAPLVAAAGWMTILFWFVPGIRGANAWLRATCELSADAWAVEHGEDPIVLASSLVRVKALARAEGFAGSPALAAVGATLPARVERLLARGRHTERRSPLRVALVALSVVWVTATVLGATAFGNH